MENDELADFIKTLDDNKFYIVVNDGFDYTITGPAPGKMVKSTLDEDLPAEEAEALAARKVIVDGLKTGRIFLCELVVTPFTSAG